jgi:pimeloyl-ACP methyl ester carboxylesterase
MMPRWQPSAPHGAITVIDDCWTDGRRDRDVMARVCLPTAGDFRLLLFTHSLGGSRFDYGYLSRYWAGHGYACVHLQHPDSDQRIWDRGRDDLAKFRQVATDPLVRADRVLDVRFAIDQIRRRAAARLGWEARLAPGPVGVAGHSYGAHTALCIAGQALRTVSGDLITLRDDRVGAVVAMSPSAPREPEGPEVVFRAAATPCLHVTGTDDRSPAGFTSPEARRIPYDHMDRADQYLVVFAGAGHGTFAKDAGAGSAVQAGMQLVSLAFWEAYVRADQKARAWLASGQCATALPAEAHFEAKAAMYP